MSPQAIVQPLPQNIQDWSFRGLNCTKWDFRGRDIRGCDFRNANLHGANFAECNTGKSTRQIAETVLLVSAVGLIYAFISTFIFAVVAALAILVVSVLLFSGFSAPRQSIGEVLVVLVQNALDVISRGAWVGGIALTLVIIMVLVAAVYLGKAAIGALQNATGTNFQGADLSNANFTNATLKSCRFRGANTLQTNWTGVNVDVLGCDLDFTSPRLALLANRKGNNSHYSNCDFSNQYMVGIELLNANLTESNLSHANLSHANLSHVDLTNVKANGTNVRHAKLTSIKANGTSFRHAKFTGAYIEDWSVDQNTKFDEVDCEYIYLAQGADGRFCDRRPSSGTFEPGAFEKLVRNIC